MNRSNVLVSERKTRDSARIYHLTLIHCHVPLKSPNKVTIHTINTNLVPPQLMFKATAETVITGIRETEYLMILHSSPTASNSAPALLQRTYSTVIERSSVFQSY